ncbi:GNAT family N-acetyltransferase [Halomicrococcus sp. NG-SE-24]|uniref:GNAT family N-acetyltransferase n=1 Tax=Halomicrococcus sp. NG-SE-24 TaxID=3436928 RepID=UPI003D968B0E
MVSIDGPRLARPDEFDEMMSLLDRYFAYERGGMAARLPHAYDEATPENHAIVRKDGDIVSHVGAIPQTLTVGEGNEIECWGVSGVTTDKRHRGNGYMTQLLEFWLDRMAEEGVALADLGGNRQRYAHFGWEQAGREHHYKIRERSFDGSAGAGMITTYEGGDEQVETLRELHGDEPYRVRRGRERSRTVFGQRGLETLLYESDGDTAYLSLTRESRERTIAEFGGAARGIEALIAHLFSAYDVDSLTAIVPPRHPRNPEFRRHSRSWSVSEHRKLNVRNLQAVLARFADQMEARWSRREVAASGRVTLGLEAESEGVELVYDRDGITVEAFDGTPEVRRPRGEMAGLLFGMHDREAELKADYPVFETIFPLDFFIWPADRV